MARLFLAIWPGAAAAVALGDLALDVARVCEGRPVERSKIHLTLTFLGEIDAAREAGIGDVARAMPTAGRFDLVLDRVGSFRRSRVAWAGASSEPPELMTLQSGLEARLRAAGFVLEDRPYRPHFTLARKIARPLPDARVAPVQIACEAFALVVSAGGKYTTRESWPLG